MTMRYAVLIALAFLCGCAVGPNYHRPAVETPQDWRWKKAALTDVEQNGAWWEVFKDEKLNELESAALEANQDIKAAVGRVDEARALARLSKADFFPQITANPAFTRSEQSANTFIPGFSSGNLPGIRKPHNDFLFPLELSYEADVWGRVRRSTAAARDRAEASIADYHTVLLTVGSDIALNYFLVRALDAEAVVLENTLKTRNESLKLVSSQFKFGAVDALDLARAKTDVATTKANIANNKRQREEVVNMLVILTGKLASSLTLEEKPLAIEPPEIPAGLPSALLERRPDVTHAERLLAASNEEIGVAKAAYFPRLALTSSGGFESQELTHLFNGPSAIWAVAANIMQPVFTGGRNRSQLEAAKARYEQNLAAYREQVLVSFKDVEDALVDIQLRGEQGKAIAEAIQSAREVTKLATTRYEKGQVSYLDVVDAQRRQLEVEAQGPLILGERLSATVRLIKSLGGGWNRDTGMAPPTSELYPEPAPPLDDSNEKKPEAPDLNQ